MMPGGHGSHADLPPLPPLVEPEPRGDVPVPATARDENPDPAIVEVSLTAAATTVAYLDGRPAAAWAYNDSVPGPIIEAHKGDQIIVHFTNDLAEPTTIHWHGLRVPNDMDGAGRLAQPIPPGGRFDYRFVVPDAGLYWYHPHVRSEVEVDKGLYGAIVVTDPGEPALDAADERVLVLDDILVDPASGAVDDRLDMRGMMMGREGNLLLVNGQPSNRAITVAPGARTRLRLVNAATARFFSLRLDGGTLVQIGTDGGLLPAPRALSSLLLTPGERADVMVETTTGATLRSIGYERAMGAGPGGEAALVRLVTSGAAVMPRPLPMGLRSIDVLAPTGRLGTSRLGERMAHHEWLFTINDTTFPNVPPVMASLGARPSWTISNESGMDHPFHLHGFFFQRRGVPEWKDTIDVPANSSIEIVVDLALRPGAAGDWMYHCHILEHAERGMMGALTLR
jgi:FtsP/CotA-like multicopper oxidase with cupredoxin domain